MIEVNLTYRCVQLFQEYFNSFFVIVLDVAHHVFEFLEVDCATLILISFLNDLIPDFFFVNVVLEIFGHDFDNLIKLYLACPLFVETFETDP